MGAHCFTRRRGVALLDGRQNSLVMELSALGTSVDVKNSASLLAQETDD